MCVLCQKLRFLEDKLKVWNKETFGNIHANVSYATIQVDEIQKLIDLNGALDSLLDQEKIAQINLENVLHVEGLF
jgi:hypothetical protein